MKNMDLLKFQILNTWLLIYINKKYMENRYYCFLESTYCDKWFILDKKETPTVALKDIPTSVDINEAVEIFINKLKNYNFKSVSKDKSHTVSCYLLDTFQNVKVIINVRKDRFGIIINKDWNHTRPEKFEGIEIKPIKVKSNQRPKQKLRSQELSRYKITYYAKWDPEHDDIQHEWVYANSKSEARSVAFREIGDLGEIVLIEKL